MISPEDRREYHRMLKLAFPDKYRAARKKYKSSPAGRAAVARENASEAARVRKKRWQQSEKGKAHIKAYQKEYNSTDNGRAKNLAKCLRWQSRNPEKIRTIKQVYSAARRAKERAGFDFKEVSEIYNRAQELRNWGLDVAVDHIIPLSKGGPHAPNNMQIIYRKENSRKGSSLSYVPEYVFI